MKFHVVELHRACLHLHISIQMCNITNIYITNISAKVHITNISAKVRMCLYFSVCLNSSKVTYELRA